MIITCPACGAPVETAKPQQSIMAIDCPECKTHSLGVVLDGQMVKVLSSKEDDRRDGN